MKKIYNSPEIMSFNGKIQTLLAGSLGVDLTTETQTQYSRLNLDIFMEDEDDYSDF